MTFYSFLTKVLLTISSTCQEYHVLFSFYYLEKLNGVFYRSR